MSFSTASSVCPCEFRRSDVNKIGHESISPFSYVLTKDNPPPLLTDSEATTKSFQCSSTVTIKRFTNCLETVLHNSLYPKLLIIRCILTFIGLCIANIFSEYNQQDATFLSFFISVRRSTCFRRVFRPSSGAQNCTYSVRHLSDRY